jgi:hypothetical protein
MKPQDNNQKNFIVAMLLMLGVLMAWQYFYAKPALEKAQQQAEVQQQQQGTSPGRTTIARHKRSDDIAVASTRRHLAGARRHGCSWCLRCLAARCST